MTPTTPQVPTVTGPPPKKNGNTPVRPPIGGSELASRFASAYEEVKDERDQSLAKCEQMRADVERATNLIKQATDENLLLKDEIASLRRQIETLKLECIHAIAERGATEATLESMMAIGRAFQIKNVPIVQPLDRQDREPDQEG